MFIYIKCLKAGVKLLCYCQDLSDLKLLNTLLLPHYCCHATVLSDSMCSYRVGHLATGIAPSDNESSTSESEDEESSLKPSASTASFTAMVQG